MTSCRTVRLSSALTSRISPNEACRDNWHPANTGCLRPRCQRLRMDAPVPASTEIVRPSELCAWACPRCSNPIEESSHASVLHPSLTCLISAVHLWRSPNRKLQWAIQKMISTKKKQASSSFRLLLAADRSTPVSDPMFNRTYANPRFCARCNDYTTMGFMACLLHRMGLTEGVLTDPYAGVAHECLRLAYPPQFGPNCESVPSRSSYDRYLQPSFANTENRLGMSVAMTHAIFSRIEEVLSTPSPAGRPAQIPLIRFIPSPPVVGRVQIRSGGSVQNLNYCPCRNQSS